MFLQVVQSLTHMATTLLVAWAMERVADRIFMFLNTIQVAQVLLAEQV